MLTGVYGNSFGSSLLATGAVATLGLIVFTGVRGLLPTFFQPYRHRQKTLGRFPWFIDVFLRPLDEFGRKGDLVLLYVLHQTVLLTCLLTLSGLNLLVLIPVYSRGTSQSERVDGWVSITISHIEPNSMAYLFPTTVTCLYSYIVLFYYTRFNAFYTHVKHSYGGTRHLLLLNLPKDLCDRNALRVACGDIYGDNVETIIPLSGTAINAVREGYLHDCTRKKYKERLLACQRLVCRIQYHQMRKERIQGVGRLAAFQRMFYSAFLVRETVKLRHTKSQVIALLHKTDQIRQRIELAITGTRVASDQFQREVEAITYPDFSDYQCLRATMPLIGSETILEQDTVPIRTPFSSALITLRTTRAAQMASQLIFSSNRAKPRVIPIDPNQLLWRNICLSDTRRSCLAVIFCLTVLAYATFYFLPSTFLNNYIVRHASQWFQRLYTPCMWIGCKETPSLSEETRASMGKATCYLCYKITSYVVVFLPTLVSIVFNSLLPVITSGLVLIARPLSIVTRRVIEYYTLFWMLVLIQGLIQLVTPSILSETGLLDISLLLDYSLQEILKQIGQNMPSQVFPFLTYAVTKYYMLSTLSLFRPLDILLACVLRLQRKEVRTPMPVRFKYAKLTAYSSHMICIGLLFGIIAPISMPVVTFAYLCIAAVDRYNILYVYPPLEEYSLSPSIDVVPSVFTTLFIGYSFMLVATGAYYLLLSGWVRVVCTGLNFILLIISITIKLHHDRKFSKHSMDVGLWKTMTLERNSILTVDESVWRNCRCVYEGVEHPKRSPGAWGHSLFIKYSAKMDKNSVLLYLRVTANTISLILTLTFYILVFKRQTDALNVVRVREVVHAYYLLSLLAQVLFMPQSILVNLIKEKLLVGDRPRRIWELVSLALYTEVEEIIPAFLVALVIVSALDTINNTAKLWKVVLWGMTAYVPITFLVHVGCLMSPDFCASTPMVEKIILYARELFVCIPYFLSLVFIVILFRKGREIQEMDRAVALMNEQGFEETIQNTALRRWQVTTLFILRSLSMTISLVWNVTWVTLYFQTTPPFPIQLTEVALYLAYNALNASVFFMKRRRRPLAAPLVAFSVESTEVNDQ